MHIFILIENSPKLYSWGSVDTIPEFLGVIASGEPQAELWIGTHPSSPSRLVKGTVAGRTLVDLVEDDPVRYGVDGLALPFLLKILAIEFPLSLQAHPTMVQAIKGYGAEEELGIAIDSSNRNYRDRNHKPELLVAMSHVSALCGFRALEESLSDITVLAELLPEGPGKVALLHAAGLCAGTPEAARRAILNWALSPGSNAVAAVRELQRLLVDGTPPASNIHPDRLNAILLLTKTHPDDPGILVSLLLHLVHLNSGEAIYLGAGELHAYLSGTAVEVMASSDNVLRGGLTEKRVDVDELCRIVKFEGLVEPRIGHRNIGPGLISWDPEGDDFRLMRATLSSVGENDPPTGAGRKAEIPAHYPLTVIVTRGSVRVERPEGGIAEIANLSRGQSLYVSAGESITLVGNGEAFIATVGEGWNKNSRSNAVLSASPTHEASVMRRKFLN